MVYYNKKDYKLIGFEVSKRQGKMYNGLLERKKDKKIIRVPFGDATMENYRDITGLNAYPQLIHNDKNRRRLYRLRHKKDLKDGYYSAGFFSWSYLW